MKVGVELDSRERAVLADLSRCVPLPDIDNQVVAYLLRQAFSVRAYLQRSVVTADPMRASSKHHERERIGGNASGSGACRAKRKQDPWHTATARSLDLGREAACVVSQFGHRRDCRPSMRSGTIPF